VSAAEKEASEAKFRDIAEAYEVGWAAAVCCCAGQGSMWLAVELEGLTLDTLADTSVLSAAYRMHVLPSMKSCPCIYGDCSASLLLLCVPATQVLSDDEKRAAYDRGDDLDQQMGGGNPFQQGGFHSQGGYTFTFRF
jgi:hypothetical protein